MSNQLNIHSLNHPLQVSITRPEAPVVLNTPGFSEARFSSSRSQLAAQSVAKNIPSLPESTFADKFFQLSTSVDNYFKKNWLQSSNPIKQLIGRPLHVVSRAFSDHDYSRMFSIKGAGRVGVIPPLGSIAVIVIPVTLLGRLFCSYRRSTDVDNRELGDVLRRDLPTLAILVYMLDPLVNTASHMLQRRMGLQLMTHVKDAKAGDGLLGRMWSSFNTSAHPMNYTQLDRYYTLNSPQRLAAIMNEQFNHKGLLTALKRFGKSSMTTDESALFTRFQKQFESALRSSRNKRLAANGPIIQQLFSKMAEFDRITAQSARPHNIRQFIASSAKTARHYSAFLGLAIIVGLLGFGVTKFNEWWSVYQYKQTLADQKRQGPHAHKSGG